jgi:lipoprotein-anchoring transpeptidase ErfK/SrfK
MAALNHQRTPLSRQKKPKLRFNKAVFLVLLVLLCVGSLTAWHYSSRKSNNVASVAIVKQPTTKTTQPAATTTTPVAKPTTTVCSNNTLSQLILVSISQRHLWACDYGQQVYDSAVVTGMEAYPADLTPPGTYHIYAKETDLTLKGCDTTGCWNDYVSYYMPFLDNQYGSYGFHDATWRSPSDFGNISPDSNNASHGCVECPLATAKWLYGWAPIGTTVTINS